MSAQELPFFSNTACPYFPCHEDISPESFNCIFCFCPLYTLGEECGGAFRYLEGNVKDCSGCSLPHHENDGNTMVNAAFEKLASLARQKSRYRKNHSE